MFSVGKILVPVDFSDNCKAALRYAQSVARHFGSEVAILHVYQPTEGSMVGLDPSSGPVFDYIRDRHAQYLRHLDAFSSELTEEGVTRAAVEGDAALELVRYAEKEHVDLIVMPTHGYGPVRQFLLGSVTAKVLHDAKCPVWTGVHMEPPPDPDVRIQTVACAVDVGINTRNVLCWSAKFAMSWNAKLQVLHVASETTQQPCRDEMEAVARTSIAPHQEAIGIPSELRVGHGKVPRTVVSLAREANADILIVGRSHRSGGGHLPTNAYAIIRGAPCPVVGV